METITLEGANYQLIKDYRDGYHAEAVIERYTDYFQPYDYILGDWAYGKLRLKGFYKKENKNCRPLNSYENIDKYLKSSCAYDCRYFILEKIIE